MILLIEKAKEDIAKDEEVFSKILEDMLASLGYYEYLIKEEDGDDRIDNVKALFATMRYFLKNNPESTFSDYLQNVALMSGQDELVDGDFVQLMTVHTAKGLEFPIVFVIRLNDGVFPSIRSRSETGFKGLEEERRLAYVAMTRAKERLYLSCAGGFNYVVGGQLIPSQFYKESGNLVQSPLPTYSKQYDDNSFFRDPFNDGPHIDFSKPNNKDMKQDLGPKTNGITSWQVGDKVIHKKLGDGVVTALCGDDIIEVDFVEHGKKKILGNHPSVAKGD